MFRRLRSLYNGVRPYRIDDETCLRYYGSLAPRKTLREQLRREVDDALMRLPVR